MTADENIRHVPPYPGMTFEQRAMLTLLQMPTICIQRISDCGEEIGESEIVKSPSFANAQIGDHIRVAKFQRDERPPLPDGYGIVRDRWFATRQDVSGDFIEHITLSVYWP